MDTLDLLVIFISPWNPIVNSLKMQFLKGKKSTISRYSVNCMQFPKDDGRGKVAF